MSNPWRILFMGTSDFAAPALGALSAAGYAIPMVVTQPDKPAGRGLELKAPPVKKKALELGLEVFQPEKARAPEAVEAIRNARPDVIVVAAYGQILPSSILQVPGTACLNIHGSILPKYRGAAPIHYAVMAGETETGVTLMYMNEKMDEGDMLLVRKTPIGPEETTGQVHDRLAVLGSEGLLEALRLLEGGKAPRTPQDHAQATYAPSLKREQCKIRWPRPALEVVNQIRGLSPWPAAETDWNGLQLKVFSAARNPAKGPGGAPGTVLAIERDGIVVAANDGSVLVREIQPAGKKKMKASDFARGQADFKSGAVLS